RDIVRPFTPDLAAARTGIPADTIRRLAREFAGAPAACAFGRVVCGRFGTLAAWSLEVLNIVTGNLDRPGGSIFSEGLVDLVDVVARLGLDGYGKQRSRVGNLPGVLGELPSGVLADEMTTTGPAQARALVVTAGNALLSDAMGVPFLNSRVATWMRRGLRLVGLDFSPRWVMDAMIRLGPYGDRYLPWRRGFTLAEVTKHPHGVRLPEPPTGVLGRKLRTPDRKGQPWHRELEAEPGRLPGT